jgi:hypothetical protein
LTQGGVAPAATKGLEAATKRIQANVGERMRNELGRLLFSTDPQDLLRAEQAMTAAALRRQAERRATAAGAAGLQGLIPED